LERRGTARHARTPAAAEMALSSSRERVVVRVRQRGADRLTVWWAEAADDGRGIALLTGAGDGYVFSSST
jgi:hypothetical protein